MNDMYHNGENKYFSFFKRIGVIFLIIYIFTILGRSIWYNWYLQKQINQLKTENTLIEQKNSNLENLIVYYQSDSFKELEARDKLGLKMPDETVVMVPVRKITANSEQTEAQLADRTGKDNNQSKNTSNYQAWWAYIFD